MSNKLQSSDHQKQSIVIQRPQSQSQDLMNCQSLQSLSNFDQKMNEYNSIHNIDESIQRWESNEERMWKKNASQLQSKCQADDKKIRELVEEEIQLEQQESQLCLNFLNLEHFPMHILTGKFQLVKLDLSENSLTNFPVEITCLINLKVLILDYNQLTNISNNINQLQNLEVFSLAYNDIQSLPPSLKELKNLKELNLNVNLLQYFDAEICSLTNLESLFINKNYFQSLPTAITNLKHLQFLGLGWLHYLNPPIDVIQDLQSNPDFFNMFYQKLNQFQEKHQVKQIGFFEFIQLLTKQKIDFLLEDSSGRNKLFESSNIQEIGVIQCICRKFPKIINQQDQIGHTPLTLGLIEQKMRSVGALMKFQLDFFAGGGLSGRPIHIAVYKLCSDIVKHILEKTQSYDINMILDTDGNSALHICFGVFDQNPHEAEKIAKYLMQAGSDPNAFNYSQLTPLMIATKKNQIYAIKWAINFNKVQKAEVMKNQTQLGKEFFWQRNLMSTYSKQVQLKRASVQKLQICAHQESENRGIQESSEEDEEQEKKSSFTFNFNKKGGRNQMSILHMAAAVGNYEILDTLGEQISVDLLSINELNMGVKDVSIISCVVHQYISKLENKFFQQNLKRKFDVPFVSDKQKKCQRIQSLSPHQMMSAKPCSMDEIEESKSDYVHVIHSARETINKHDNDSIYTDYRGKKIHQNEIDYSEAPQTEFNRQNSILSSFGTQSDEKCFFSSKIFSSNRHINMIEGGPVEDIIVKQLNKKFSQNNFEKSNSKNSDSFLQKMELFILKLVEGNNIISELKSIMMLKFLKLVLFSHGQCQIYHQYLPKQFYDIVSKQFENSREHKIMMINVLIKKLADEQLSHLKKLDLYVIEKSKQSPISPTNRMSVENSYQKMREIFIILQQIVQQVNKKQNNLLLYCDIVDTVKGLASSKSICTQFQLNYYHYQLVHSSKFQFNQIMPNEPSQQKIPQSFQQSMTKSSNNLKEDSIKQSMLGSTQQNSILTSSDQPSFVSINQMQNSKDVRSFQPVSLRQFQFSNSVNISFTEIPENSSKSSCVEPKKQLQIQFCQNIKSKNADDSFEIIDNDD